MAMLDVVAADLLRVRALRFLLPRMSICNWQRKTGCQLGNKGGGVGSCEMATGLSIAVSVGGIGAGGATC